MSSQEYIEYLDKILLKKPEKDNLEELGYWCSCYIMRNSIMRTLGYE